MRSSLRSGLANIVMTACEKGTYDNKVKEGTIKF